MHANNKIWKKKWIDKSNHKHKEFRLHLFIYPINNLSPTFIVFVFSL